MPRILTFSAMALGGLGFGWLVPLEHLADALQALITALSIMLAAVLVRLNRGMPTVDWKSIEPAQRRSLTAAVAKLTGEYATIAAILALGLGVCLTLILVGKASLIALAATAVQHSAAGLVGALIGLGGSRMVYVVWRDVDVVNLQRKIIDDASRKEETLAAETKVTSIRASIRPGNNPPSKAWGE